MTNTSFVTGCTHFNDQLSCACYLLTCSRALSFVSKKLITTIFCKRKKWQIQSISSKPVALSGMIGWAKVYVECHDQLFFKRFFSFVVYSHLNTALMYLHCNIPTDWCAGIHTYWETPESLSKFTKSWTYSCLQLTQYSFWVKQVWYPLSSLFSD